MSNGENGTIPNAQIEVTNIHNNLEQTLISVTEDKLRLILIGYLNAIEKNNSWIAPAGILTTIVIVFTTSTFKEFGLPASAWQAVFFITGVISLGWLIKALLNLKLSTSVDDIIRKIKNES